MRSLPQSGTTPLVAACPEAGDARAEAHSCAEVDGSKAGAAATVCSPTRKLGPKSRKNSHESHERGKPTAIFSKRRKIDTL